MARVAINTGAAANDGTGDTLRAAGGVINNNFLEVYTYLGAGSTTTLSAPVWSTTSIGINTLRNVGIGTTNPRFTLEVGAVGASGTTLFVNGDARITGILSIGTSSITLNGSTNIINVGTGVTIDGSTGIISATSIVLGGATLTGAGVTSIVAGTGITVSGSTGQVTITATGAGSSQFVVTSAGIHTLSNVGIGTTNPTSKLTVTGDGTFTGVVTATTFIGDGSGLTGVVGSGSGVIVRDSGTLVGTAGTIDFGDNLTVSAISAGVVTVTASSGGGSSQFVTTGVGIHTLSNVGIGTTNPTSKLTVKGNTSLETLNVSGVSTLGNLNVDNSTVELSSIVNIRKASGGNLTAAFDSGGTATLYYDGVQKLQTSTNGVVVNGGLTVQANGNISAGSLDLDSVSGAVGNIKALSGISTLGTLNVGTGGTVITTTSAGLVGIGTTNPTSALTVVGSGTSTSQLFVSGVSTVGVVTGATYFGDASYIVSGKWTLGANGSSDYTFTGIGFTQTTNDPTLYLARGAVYEFVNNMGAHPFQIQSSSGSGGTVYSNGITNNGVSNGTLRFEVPFNAPNTLYYQCTAHAGMGGTITIYPSI